MQIRLEGKTFELEVLKKKNESPNRLPILILHGFPDKANSWKKVGEYFQNLGHDVIIPTLRGYYPSYSPDSVSAYDLNVLGTDVDEILACLKVEKIILIGHDWGGILAWHFAHTNHKRIEKLATISVPHPIIFKSLLSKEPRQWIKSWYMFFFQLPKFGEFFLAQNKFKNLKKALNSGCDKRFFTESEFLDFENHWKDSHQLKTMIHWYRALKIKFDTSIYHELTCPTLQIIGKNDPFFISDAFKKKCTLVLKEETKILEDCGHWPHFEVREDLIKNLSLFISN